MSKIRAVTISIIIFVLVMNTQYLSPGPVEPTLIDQGANADLLITADSIHTVVEAVRAVGGSVIDELWLINGVHAIVPESNMKALAALPGIRSITRNRVVASTGGITYDGYVTNKRSVKSQLTQSGTQATPPVYLPDGGYVAVDQNGRVLIANEDGSLRKTINLPGKPFLTIPVVAKDGTIFISGQILRLFALDPSGTIRWDYALTGSTKFMGGIVLGPDGTVYAADNGRNVYAFDPVDGKLLWKFKAGTAGANTSTPTVGTDGSIYFTTDKGYVYAVNPNGTQKWSFYSGVALNLSPIIGINGEVYVVQGGGKAFFIIDGASGVLKSKNITPGTLRALPLIGPDGTVYLPTEPGLFALNPDGSQRFYFPAIGGSFKTTPVLSSDGTILYISVEGYNLFAVDTLTGSQRWKYTTTGKMMAAPAVDQIGAVIVGTDTNLLDIINPLGVRINNITMTDKITQTAAVSPNGDITVRVGSANLVTIGLPPKYWDGKPDVNPTNNKNYYELVNPVTIDVGADQLHDKRLTTSSNIRGAGVTVAVLDSGIYFDSETVNVLTGRINKQYLGQADFVDRVCARKPDNSLAGIQYSDYCFINTSSRQYSRDGYGHGTHVAGIIWNNLYDATTKSFMGIAPDANIISVRVLGDEGIGTYATVIKGLQWVVENKERLNIRVLNLSISAPAETPYFVDPLNRAVEQAWANGLVVLAAAGNTGPGAESITVPGNDPYVITVGSVSEKRTPGYWEDDDLPTFSAAGPTRDGFMKPDILVPGTQIISFMYNECKATWAGKDCLKNSQKLVQGHGDYSSTSNLFRMSGTSMSTAIASGVAALMLQANPYLTPDQVKFRMKYSAQLAITGEGEPVYSSLQQGNGRLWAPAVVLGNFPEDGSDNVGMDIQSDLAHGAGWVDANKDGLVQYEELDPAELAFHYQGPVGKLLSDDGQVNLYYINSGNNVTILGATDTSGQIWFDRNQLDQMSPSWNGGAIPWVNSKSWASGNYTWGGGNYTWGGGNYTWGGGNYTWGGSDWIWDVGNYTWGGGNYTWGGGNYTWGGGNYTWGGGNYTWGGGNYTWGGGNYTWGGGNYTWGGGNYTWGGGESLTESQSASSTTWVDDQRYLNMIF